MENLNDDLNEVNGISSDLLFDDETLNSKMSFLEDKKKGGTDGGLYKIDLTKVKDKKRGYRSVIRLLPNFTKEGKLGDNAIERITHYANINAIPELRGYYDSPKNFEEKCILSETYYKLDQSKNAVLKEKAKLLNYSKSYYSYCLVVEDEQQPELVGKIMVLKYGVTIKNKINTEKTGDVTGKPCNVFSLEKGKDLYMIVHEIETNGNKYPDYDMCAFRPDESSISLPSKDGSLKKLPLNDDGRIPIELRDKVKNFLLARDVDIETFQPKRLTEEEQIKISQIVDYMTGQKTVGSSSTVAQEADDFSFDDVSQTRPTSTVSSESREADDFDDFDF